MKVLLDENFPIQLYRRLLEAGYDAEHIIALGLRGVPDSYIRQRLATEDDLVFITRNSEFEQLPAGIRARVIISQVPQSLPIEGRVRLWLGALEGFLSRPPEGWLFHLLESGEVVPWQTWETQ